MSGIAITFPGSPAEGQSYLAQNGFTYIYDSQKNRWKRGGDFVRAPKVLSYAGVAVTTTGSGITTGPNGALIYEIPGVVSPSSTAGIDSYKAYRYTDSYPNYTEIQVSISSAFSSVAYAATSTSTTFTIPGATLSGNTTYYLRARQFVGSNASIASTGEISGYSPNVVRFTTASVFLDTPTIVSIAGTTGFPVYQIGFAGTTLPATVTYTGSGVGNLDKVEWRVTGPRNPDSTGDTALAEVGIGTLSSATLANSLVLAMPFSGAAGVGIANDVNNAIRSASGASAGTTKTITANGNAGIATVGIASTTAHFYNGAAYFDGTGDYLAVTANSDLSLTGDFTIEMWIYMTAFESNMRQISSGNYVTVGKNGTWYFGLNSTSYTFYTYDGTSNDEYVILTETPSLNKWYHLAAVRKGTLVSLYLDGILRGTGTIAKQLVDGADGGLQIGRLTIYGDHNGYIQDLKIYKGTAKYTENFTPPLPTYGTISYTTSTIGSVGIATTAFLKSTGDIPTAEVAIGSSTAAQVASSLVLAMPLNNTFGFQDINVAVRGLTSGASAGTAKTVGLGTTSTANAPSHPRISATKSRWYDGAAYFDGGDYLSIPSNSDFNLGTGNYTIEGWIYPANADTNNKTIFSTNWGAGGSILITYDHVTNKGFDLFDYTYNSGSPLLSTSGTYGDNIWYHIAVVRSSGTSKIYINGIQAASATQNSDLTRDVFVIGAVYTSGSESWNGYMQDIKIYKGFAKYTANFTPPQPICGFTTDLAIQTGFTTTSATGALLSSVVGLGSTSTLAFGADQTYSGITSITSSSGITTLPDTYAQNLVLALPLANITGVGNSFTNDRNTQIRTASITGAGVTAGTTKTITNTGVTTVSLGSTSKWYGNAAYFDGNDYISVSTNSDLDFGAGDFTIEFWANSLSSGNHWIMGKGNAATVSGSTFSLDTGPGWSFYYNTSSTLALTSPTYTNEWAHIAVVRNGTEIRIYKNGSLFSSGTIGTGTLNATADDLQIGKYSSTGITGYLQDIKIYKGTAKYTSNFTPPPPMFGDYVRSTPNKIVFTPGSDYVLEARNTATGGIVTSTYSASRQWGTKPEGGIYDPYGANLVLAIPGGAVGGATSTFDVTGQIRFETPTATYVNAGIVTYSNSLGIGTYGNKSITNTGPVSISSTITKYYSRSMQFNGTSAYLLTSTSSDLAPGNGDFTIECWFYIDATPSDDPIFESRSVNGGTDGFTLTAFSSSVIRIFTSSAILSISNLSYQGRWVHIAICRRSSVTSMFIDGILQGTTTSLGNLTNNDLIVGGGRYGAGATISNFFGAGYMTDVRFYKGLAKYTSNFTPPNQIYLT